jgi:hypothetical protein
MADASNPNNKTVKPSKGKRPRLNTALAYVAAAVPAPAPAATLAVAPPRATLAVASPAAARAVAPSAATLAAALAAARAVAPSTATLAVAPSAATLAAALEPARAVAPSAAVPAGVPAAAAAAAVVSKSDAFNEFFGDHGLYKTVFGDGTLIRMLGVADSIHDFRHGYRGAKQGDPQGKSAASGFFERVRTFETDLYKSNTSLDEGIKDKISGQQNNLFIDGYSDIEHYAKDFYEGLNEVGWISPISQTLTTSQILKGIADNHTVQVYLASIRLGNASIEIVDDARIIKGDDGESRKKICDFVIGFLFDDPKAECYLTCDAGPNIIKNLVNDSKNVGGLIVPQNISDSATAGGLNLSKEKPDTYHFPVGTDPLLDINGPSAANISKFEGTVANNPLNLRNLLKEPAGGAGGVVPPPIFQSVANFFTGPYGFCMHFKQEEGEKFEESNKYCWKQVITMPTNEQIELKYGEGASSGASVNQLLELQIKHKSWSGGTTFPGVVPSGGQIRLSDILKTQTVPVLQKIKDGLNSNEKPHSLYFDIKRAGDQDQCLAVHLARKVLTNVALVTVDPTCAIRNRSYDNPTIEHLGNTIRLYRSVYSETKMPPERLREIEYKSLKIKSDTYVKVFEFLNSSNIEEFEKIKTILNEKIGPRKKRDFNAEETTNELLYPNAAELYTIKLEDTKNYLQRLYGKNIRDFGVIEPKEAPLNDDIIRAKDILSRNIAKWKSTQSEINTDKNLNPITFDFINEYMDIIGILYPGPAPGAAAPVAPAAPAPTEEGIILLLDFVKFYEYNFGRPSVGSIELIFKTYDIIKTPTSDLTDIIGEIESYNEMLSTFCNNLYNYKTGKDILKKYRIIIANNREEYNYLVNPNVGNAGAWYATFSRNSMATYVTEEMNEEIEYAIEAAKGAIAAALAAVATEELGRGGSGKGAGGAGRPPLLSEKPRGSRQSVRQSTRISARLGGTVAPASAGAGGTSIATKSLKDFTNEANKIINGTLDYEKSYETVEEVSSYTQEFVPLAKEEFDAWKKSQGKRIRIDSVYLNTLEQADISVKKLLETIKNAEDEKTKMANLKSQAEAAAGVVPSGVITFVDDSIELTNKIDGEYAGYVSIEINKYRKLLSNARINPRTDRKPLINLRKVLKDNFIFPPIVDTGASAGAGGTPARGGSYTPALYQIGGDRDRELDEIRKRDLKLLMEKLYPFFNFVSDSVNNTILQDLPDLKKLNELNNLQGIIDTVSIYNYKYVIEQIEKTLEKYPSISIRLLDETGTSKLEVYISTIKTNSTYAVGDETAATKVLDAVGSIKKIKLDLAGKLEDFSHVHATLQTEVNKRFIEYKNLFDEIVEEFYNECEEEEHDIDAAAAAAAAEAAAVDNAVVEEGRAAAAEEEAAAARSQAAFAAAAAGLWGTSRHTQAAIVRDKSAAAGRRAAAATAAAAGRRAAAAEAAAAAVEAAAARARAAEAAAAAEAATARARAAAEAATARARTLPTAGHDGAEDDGAAVGKKRGRNGTVRLVPERRYVPKRTAAIIAATKIKEIIKSEFLSEKEWLASLEAEVKKIIIFLESNEEPSTKVDYKIASSYIKFLGEALNNALSNYSFSIDNFECSITGFELGLATFNFLITNSRTSFIENYLPFLRSIKDKKIELDKRPQEILRFLPSLSFLLSYDEINDSGLKSIVGLAGGGKRLFSKTYKKSKNIRRRKNTYKRRS